MNAVFDRGPENPAQRLMMLALADNANDQGVCWPSVATLARKASVVERTARRTLTTLEAEGWVAVTASPGKLNVYRLNLERLDPGDGSLSGQPPMPTGPRTPTSGVAEPTPLTPTSPTPDAHVRGTPDADVRGPRTPTSAEPSRTITTTVTEPSGGDGSAAPPAKPAPKSKRATARPADFRPSDAHVALAAELGVDLRAEWPKFCDHHDARGTTFKDWDAALRTWIRNAKRFGARTPAKTDTDMWDRAQARAEAREQQMGIRP